jgi:hypothetical protein
MTPIQAADPASKTAYTFTDVGALHNAIATYGYIPLRADGSPAEVQFLQEYGGYVMDGAPLNVWMNGVWLEGQKEAMEPFWTSGQVRRPTTNIMNAGVAPMPPEVAAQTKAYQAAQGGLFGMDIGTLVAVGAGLAAIWWISRK